MHLIRFLMALILFAGAAGQEPPQIKELLLRLGMERDEVLKALGEPRECYAADVHRHIKDCSTAYSIYSGVVWEVYSRKTVRTEYEIRLGYRADATESRLHPKVRLSGVWFVLDKPMPAFLVLADIEEASKICSHGCRLWGLQSGKREVVAFVESPTPEETRFAGLVATGWREGSGSWRPAVRLTWTDAQDVGDRSRPWSGDWLLQSIEEVYLSVLDPAFEAKITSGPYDVGRRPIDLGSWKP